MADTRTVFTILEDNSTAEGVKLPARSIGDATGGNHVPAIVAQDSSGNYALIPLNAAGGAAGDGVPGLVAKDSAGNLQYVSVRDSGEASSGVDATIVIGSVDSAGNFSYVQLRQAGQSLASVNVQPGMVAVDGSDLGQFLEVRQPGVTNGGVNALASMVAQDGGGNFQYIDIRSPGDAAFQSFNVPTLPAKDAAGNLQHIAVRDEGEAASGVDSIPGLVAVDGSGNLKYLKVNTDGELLISVDSDGTKKSAYAKVTPSGINTLTTVVNLTLVADAVYEEIGLRASCSHPVMWELVQVDDATLTVLDSFLTGPGQFTFNMKYDHLEFTAGSTGTQQLRLRGTQLSGNASDMHGFVEAFEKA